MRTIKRRPIVCPFTILVDGREKASWRFQGIKADASQCHRCDPEIGRLDVVVPVQWAHLATGDYSVDGMQERVTVERKSAADLFQTLGQHRDRFEREHERMSDMERACVVIESSWFDLLNFPPERSQLKPKTVFRTAASWFARYGVPWFAMDDRRTAERFAFRFLQNAWKQREGASDGET